MTSLRFLCAVGLVVFPLSSPLFWWSYACGIVSDLVDGPLARHMATQGEFGARLDSAADLAFAGGIALCAVRYLSMPMWLWMCIDVVAVVRLAGYVIGYVRYHAFSALHTVLNKVTGLLVAIVPILFLVSESNGTAAIGCAAAMCVVAFVSSMEEMALTLTSRELDRDRRGLLFRSGKGFGDQ
ncbi:MAG: CDP-alcohol phosphatidyltransferase family protein [Bifidobacterium sp.]